METYFGIQLLSQKQNCEKLKIPVKTYKKFIESLLLSPSTTIQDLEKYVSNLFDLSKQEIWSLTQSFNADYLSTKKFDKDEIATRLANHLFKWNKKVGTLSCNDIEQICMCYSLRVNLVLNKYNSLKISDELSPLMIFKRLSKIVIGQDLVLRDISYWIYNELIRKKIIYPNNFENYTDTNPVTVNNLMLFGPTGCGKSHTIITTINEVNNILREYSIYKKIECVYIDCSVLVEEGITGQTVRDKFTDALLHLGMSNFLSAIIVFEEFDKLAKKPVGAGGKHYNLAIQQELLSIIDGQIISIRESKDKYASYIDISTKNMGFIFCGAFDGIDHLINLRLNKGKHELELKKICDFENLSTYFEPQEDLAAYGFLPELIGRINMFSYIKLLCEKDFHSIIKASSIGFVSQYENYFHFHGKHLVIDDSAIYEIARIAVKSGVGGARNLKRVLSDILSDSLFYIKENPFSNVVITGDDILLAQNKKYRAIYDDLENKLSPDEISQSRNASEDEIIEVYGILNRKKKRLICGILALVNNKFL